MATAVEGITRGGCERGKFVFHILCGSGNRVGPELESLKQARHPSRHANHETCGNAQPIAALKRCPVCLQLCNYFAAAKHRGEHQRRHAPAGAGERESRRANQPPASFLHRRGRQAHNGSIDEKSAFTRGRNDPGSSPCSKPRQSREQISPARRSFRKLPPARGDWSLNQRQDQPACRST